MFSIFQSSLFKKYFNLAFIIPNARSTFTRLDDNDLFNFFFGVINQGVIYTACLTRVLEGTHHHLTK